MGQRRLPLPASVVFALSLVTAAVILQAVMVRLGFLAVSAANTAAEAAHVAERLVRMGAPPNARYLGRAR